MSNREIKFRAWDLDNFGMFYSDKLDESGDVPIIWVTDESGTHFEEYQTWHHIQDGEDVETEGYVEPKQTLMQYTGLKDKNGKEIYEGDIIEWELSVGGKKDRAEMKFETENGNMFDEGAGMIRTTPYINDTSEVIGNIYENPELLT